MPRKKKTEKVEDESVEDTKPTEEEPTNFLGEMKEELDVFPGTLAEVEEEPEVVKEVATDEPKTEEETAQAQPQETEESEPEKEPVEPTQAERLARLYQQLLDIYEAAPPGHISLGYVLEETGASKIEIDQTWDKLYDQRKVPYSRLYKPES